MLGLRRILYIITYLIIKIRSEDEEETENKENTTPSPSFVSLPILRIQKISSTKIKITLDNGLEKKTKKLKLKKRTQILEIHNKQSQNYKGGNNHIVIALEQFTYKLNANFNESCRIPLLMAKTEDLNERSIIKHNDNEIILNSNYFGYSKLNHADINSEINIEVFKSDIQKDLSKQKIIINPFDTFKKLTIDVFCLIFEENEKDEEIFDFELFFQKEDITKIEKIILPTNSKNSTEYFSTSQDFRINPNGELSIKFENTLNYIEFNSTITYSILNYINLNYLINNDTIKEKYYKKTIKLKNITEFVVNIINKDENKLLNANIFIKTGNKIEEVIKRNEIINNNSKISQTTIVLIAVFSIILITVIIILVFVLINKLKQGKGDKNGVNRIGGSINTDNISSQSNFQNILRVSLREDPNRTRFINRSNYYLQNNVDLVQNNERNRGEEEDFGGYNEFRGDNGVLRRVDVEFNANDETNEEISRTISVNQQQENISLNNRFNNSNQNFTNNLNTNQNFRNNNNNFQNDIRNLTENPNLDITNNIHIISMNLSRNVNNMNNLIQIDNRNVIHNNVNNINRNNISNINITNLTKNNKEDLKDKEGEVVDHSDLKYEDSKFFEFNFSKSVNK